MELRVTRPRLLHELEALPEGGLAAALEPLGIVAVTAFGRIRGGTSTCYLLRAEAHPRDFVLKCPLAGESIALEWDVLCRVAGAPATRARLPRPVAVLPGGAGFVMERVRGVPLVRYAPLRHRDEREAVAAAVVAGLRDFHRSLERPFGDFHARNILMDSDGGPVFIDVGESADLQAGTSHWEAVAPMVGDLGLWVYNTCLDVPGNAHSSPLGQLNLARFAVSMVAAAAADERDARAFCRDVFARARRHARRMRQSPWRARRATAPLVMAGLLVLERAAGREISRRTAARAGGPRV
ncbi:MAG: hypothetical protein IT302_06460 [Dehalococcoidia bacterium]|nr:hypothetical protein [Dehalococcoidia bacterium]